MGVIKHRVAVWFVVMLFAIASAVVAFQMTSGTGGPRILDGQLLADPNPDKGNDCPYPPAGGYGSGNSGKTAKGRDKHCNAPPKGAKGGKP